MCSSALGCIAQAQEEDPRVLTACVRAPLRKSLPPYKSSYHSALRTLMKGIAPLVWMSCLVLGCERGKDCGDPLPPNAANVECGCMAVSDTGQDSPPEPSWEESKRYLPHLNPRALQPSLVDGVAVQDCLSFRKSLQMASNSWTEVTEKLG